MAKLFNLAQMTTATAGTGTITLGSAVAPFITFAAAGVQNNDVVAYSIIDGVNSEMGYGTYSAAGPTLTRNLRKSSTGALLNLSGSAIVRLTPGREDIINSDGSIAFVANLDMGSNRIINVSDPTGTQDAATKNYVDVAISGVTGSGSGHNPVTLGIANGLVLSNQVLSLDLASSTTTGSVSAADWTTFNSKQAALGFTPENVVNKDIDAALAANSDTKYPSQKAVKAYIDAGLATGTHTPVTLGTANGLSLSGQQLSLGFSSGTASGALSGSDWQLFNSKQAALGFTPENVANKTQLVRSSGTSSTLYPSESAVSGFVASSIANIPAAGGNIGSFLLSGGGVTWVTGYQFRVSAAQYYIQGVLYSSAEQLITLTGSDGTFDRIDVIVVNTSGQVDKVTGIATSSPSEPDIDPATQLQLAFIIVYAASSSPIINSQTIYSEKAGSPTEWNWSSTGSTWNLASTNNPFAGTKDIEATALGANAYAQGMATGTANLGIYTQLNFYVRSKATWNTGRGLYVAWYLNGVRKGSNIFLAHGFYNFNSDNTTDYQLISIPISQFAVPNGTSVNQLRFTRVGGAIGFYLDEIIVTDSGLTSTPVGLTQDQADARYVLRVSTTDNAIMRADGATGEIQNSVATVSDSGTVNIPTGTSYNIGGVPHTHATHAYYQNLAALLEPDALEVFKYGTFTYSVDSSHTKYILASFNTKIGSTAVRFDIRDPRIPFALRGNDLIGLTASPAASESSAITLDPTLPAYADPYTKYFDRLKTITETSVKAVYLNGSVNVPFLPGAYGAIILRVTFTDLTWLIGRYLNGVGFNLENEISDSTTTRADNALMLPVNKKVICEVESAGTGSGGVAFIILPSTWSVIADTNTYSFRDDFMGTVLNTGTWNRTVSTAGNIEIDTTYQWCKVDGNGNWGQNGIFAKTSFTRASGQKFVVDVYTGNAPDGMYGLNTGAGYSYTNFCHAINFNGTSLEIYEDGTKRSTVGTACAAHSIYRLRITPTVGGSSATYEIQGTNFADFGSASWTDITPGTSSTATNTFYPGMTIFGNAHANYCSDFRVYP